MPELESTAASQEGFGHPNGMALAENIAQIRIFKPKVVLMEQVPGFESHPHHGLAMRLMHWAGYHLVFKDTFDVASISPSKRNRWLALFIHVDQLPHITSAQMKQFAWPTFRCTTRSFDAILSLPNQLSQEFEPTVEAAARYFQPDFMPGRIRQWTHKQWYVCNGWYVMVCM